VAFFQHQGRLIHYDLESGAVPHDTLFIHGFLGSNAWWRPTVTTLSERYQTGVMGGRVALAEWPGSGLSTAPLRMEELAPKDIAGLFLNMSESLGLHDLNIVAHSFGALVALNMALENPALVQKLVLVNPAPVSGRGIASRVTDLFDRMAGDRSLCQMTVEGWIGTLPKTPASEKLHEQIMRDVFATDRRVWEWMPQILNNKNHSVELKDISQPSLILWGDRDPFVPKAEAEYIAQNLENAELRILPALGHSPQLEAPELFTELTAEFLFGD
jgi:pimeloyl-ACP methyl ester carboxylesterase